MAAPHGDSSPRSDSLPASRPRGRTGLWLIGAKGGVATTVITGLAALARGTTEPHGLVTALSPCARLDLVGFDEIVIGGHDIRPGHLADEARRMWVESRAITPEVLDAAADSFATIEQRLRPGTVVAAGDKIRELADPSVANVVETPREAIDRIRADIEAFAAHDNLRHVVVVNVASTEPPADRPIPERWSEVATLLGDAAACPLPASSLYAVAAFEAGIVAAEQFLTTAGQAVQPSLDRLRNNLGITTPSNTGGVDTTGLSTLPEPIQFALATPLLDGVRGIKDAAGVLMEGAVIIRDTFKDGVKVMVQQEQMTGGYRSTTGTMI